MASFAPSQVQIVRNSPRRWLEHPAYEMVMANLVIIMQRHFGNTWSLFSWRDYMSHCRQLDRHLHRYWFEQMVKCGLIEHQSGRFIVSPNGLKVLEPFVV
ncbi:hypothetical protein HGA91_00135 [candidate division WWE3 bacterium]|nr:hypothetical protein [candidate division WWE3 bacterium]